MPAPGQLQNPWRRRSLIQADAVGKGHERVVDALEEQFRRFTQAIDGVDGTVAVRYQPGQRHLQRPEPGCTHGIAADISVAGRHAIEHHRLEALTLFGVLGQVIDGQCPAEALAQ
ncbi:hypothetical protein D3C81_1659990 [compost metagenome]